MAAALLQTCLGQFETIADWARQAMHRVTPRPLPATSSSQAALASGLPDTSPPAVAPPTQGEVRTPAPLWTSSRLEVTDALWGDGYQLPGGETEVIRLAQPMGVSGATSMMLLGAGSGGAACTLAMKLGVWVSAFDEDANLRKAAADLVNYHKLGKKIRIADWNPADPVFTRQYFHNALALEPLRGQPPQPTLAAIAVALKPNGHLVLLELVADAPLDPTDRYVAAWARLERRDPTQLPAEVAITRVLGRLGFDIRVTEDVSQRQIHQAVMGWRRRVNALEEHPLPRSEVGRLVDEAELWMIRLRLINAGILRLVRWHAIGKNNATPVE